MELFALVFGADDELLEFLELVDTEDALVVLPCCSSLFAETEGVPAEFERKGGELEGLVGVEGSEGLLAGGDEH